VFLQSSNSRLHAQNVAGIDFLKYWHP